jgi:ubiquinone/menaquinone biosynthesis C-methylase UbiE
MTKSRKPETSHGIQGAVTVAQYNQMQRKFRDKGWIETQSIIASGIAAGHALEIGHGPGYLGLEWLKRTGDSRLTGLDISPDMSALAQRNAQEYGLSGRSEYRLGSSSQLPFEDGSFDAVFTNGSLHEWSDPQAAFNEIGRVLKPDGRYFVSDLRRDMSVFLLAFMWLGVHPAAIRPYLLTSVGAAYTPTELRAMLDRSDLREAKIHASAISIEVSGVKV